jgi:ATP-dependent DNA helicase RecG
VNWRKLGLSERQIKAVEYVETAGSITNKEYQAINKTHRVTATRDLADLVKNGFVKEGTKRGAKYFPALR